jgi:hypothetical protein
MLYKNVMELLQHSNINIILFYGSLLGYVRENNFINMDDDIDVIVSRSNYNMLRQYAISNIMKYPGLSFGLITDNFFQIHYNNIGPFDIYAFDEINNNILIEWEYIHSKNPTVSIFKSCDILPAKNIILHNCNINIPNCSENILLQTYGNTWKMPLPDVRKPYDIYTKPPELEKNNKTYRNFTFINKLNS